MLPINLIVGDEKIPIDLPQRASEIPVRKYIDFSVEMDKFVDWYNTKVEDKTIMAERTYYLYRMCRVVSEFFDIDLNTVLQYDAAALTDDAGYLKPEVMSKHIKALTDRAVSMDDLEDTLLTIVLNVNKVVQDYEPKYRTVHNHIFDYRDEKWTLPRVNVLSYHHIQFEKVTVLESIECMEIQRLSKKHKDDQGNSTLTEFLTMMAVLCRKPGEKIDIDNFENMVEERKRHFIDLTMDVVLDTVFFSQITLNKAVKALVANGFSTPLKGRRRISRKGNRLKGQKGTQRKLPTG